MEDGKWQSNLNLIQKVQGRAGQGMAEHQRKNKELIEEESSICEDALEGEYDQRRLDEIHIEIAYRTGEIEKLQGYLKS